MVARIFNADYDYSPEFKSEKSNKEVGNLNGSLTTNTWFLWKISSLSSYIIFIFFLIMMNRIDTNFINITSSYTKKAKTINICGKKDIKFSSKKILPLEWWIDCNGSSIYPGHYEYKSGFFLLIC